MGRILAHHLVRIPEAEIVGVADPTPGLAQRTASELRVPCAFEDYRELLALPEIDAVVIATPTHTHPRIAEEAAAAGKAIFCEKPLALTMEECNRAVRAVEQARVPFQMGFMRRFDAGYARAKSLIDEGVIGTPVTFKAVSRDPGMPPPGYARPGVSGGLLMDMAVHDFDLGRWLMSSEVVRTSTEGDTLVFEELRAAGDLDNAIVNLRFASGALGNVEVSRNALYGYDIRTEVLGSEGTVLIGALHEAPLHEAPVVLLTTGGVQHEVVAGFEQRFDDAYLVELRYFVDAVRGERTPGPTIHDGRAATEIALAAARSLREGRPILLPLPEGAPS